MNTSRRYTLGKNERLKSRKAIEQLFAAGQAFSMFPFRVTWMAEEGTGNEEQGRGNKEQGTAKEGTGELGTESSFHQPSTVNHPHHPLQAAFTVPRRQFKKSVHRNRIKRLMREAWRLQKNPLQEVLLTKGIRLRVFLIYNGRDLPEWTLVQEKVQRIIARLQKSLHEKPADHP